MIYTIFRTLTGGQLGIPDCRTIFGSIPDRANTK